MQGITAPLNSGSLSVVLGRSPSDAKQLTGFLDRPLTVSTSGCVTYGILRQPARGPHGCLPDIPSVMAMRQEPVFPLSPGFAADASEWGLK